MTISRDLSFLKNTLSNSQNVGLKPKHRKQKLEVQQETAVTEKHYPANEKQDNRETPQENSEQQTENDDAETFHKKWLNENEAKRQRQSEPPKKYEIQGRKQAVNSFKRVAEHSTEQQFIDRKI